MRCCKRFRQWRVFNGGGGDDSLVEEVVVHFDLGVGLEVIGHEHDGDLNVA